MSFLKITLLGVFFFGFVSNLFTEELKLIKQETSTSIKFSYQFYDFLNKSKEVSFELEKNFIQQSIGEIPSLKVLHEKIHTELPRLAYKSSEKYLAPIENDYYHHLADIQYIATQAKRNLGEDFELVFQCPKKIINYNLEFSKEKKFYYKIKSEIAACAFETKTQNAYQSLVAKITQSIEKVGKKLPAEVVYQLKTTDQGYQTIYNIPAGFSRTLHQKILKTIENNQSNIENLQNSFQEKQKELKIYFDQVVATNKSFIANIKKSQPEVLQNILQDISSQQEEEYSRYYLKVEKTKQGNSISPDYKRLVLKYKSSMGQIADALNETHLGERELANKILNFLQAIHYNDLQKRDLEYFTGFLTPPAIFYENQGDCDSKSVAFLSIAKNLFLNTKAILVLIPGHAFIGLELQTQEKDTTLEHNGIHYVLAEVAGPAISPFGTIGSKSETAIKKKDIDEIIVF